MEANLLLEVASTTILIIITFFCQFFLNLPKGSWYGILLPSLGLFFFTRVIFHYVYHFKFKIDYYVKNMKANNNIVKLLLFGSKLLPYIMLYIFCYIVLSMNSSIAESFQSIYATVIGDLPSILLKHSAKDIEKAKTLASKLLAVSFCWFILLFLIEFGISVTLQVISWFFKFLSQSSKPKTRIRKIIVSNKSDSNKDKEGDDDNDDDDADDSSEK